MGGSTDNLSILAFDNFLQELTKNSAVSFGLYSSINLATAFWKYKTSKNFNELLFNPLTSAIKPTAISTGAFGSGMVAETILNQIALIGGVPTFALVFTTTMATRAVLYRMAGRQNYVEWLEKENIQQRGLLNGLESANLP